ncbi:late embryogenesis abundant protein D-34-like [Neltuma alba]|uniref:late embryogenesis abundant protein D-34-like n=1 Tax=Neltuma alba TaxID=207710 RepID=UPI0010A4D20A|nr:late embryogenesis abundant protein D-34-like [Prosopis alba]
MSQEQPWRAQGGRQPIKYGDVFHVSGDLAQKPVAPEDAAMMQSAEARVLGQTQPGGPAAVMQSAATQNEHSGLVGHRDVNDVTGDLGVTVTETRAPGRRIVTESVAGQVVGKYVEPTQFQMGAAGTIRETAVTIGEALEAAARTVGEKPVEQSDAAAIQAAEVRATGSNVISPGGLAAIAQSAAAYNAGCARDEDKVKLGDVLRDATGRLAADKAATPEDAEGVADAEMRNSPDSGIRTPGGVAASVAAAARLNENVNL